MSDFLKTCLWICGDEKIASPLFRKAFSANKDIESAVLFCTGLGYFESYVNGMRIGDDVLVPAQTDYDYRTLRSSNPALNLKSRTKIYYLQYDVTKQIAKGDNCIGMWLGNGFYRQTEKNDSDSFSYDIPKTIVRLNIKYKDGTEDNIVSDETWFFNESPIIYNNVYYGEVFDANKTIPDWCLPKCNMETWRKAKRADTPTGTLMLQDCPTDKVQQNYLPKLIYKDYNRAVYDIGKNISGWILLGVSGVKGQEVVISFSEEIDDNKVLDYTSTTSRRTDQIQKLTYILNDEMIQYYTPKFSWASFRYIEVETRAEIFELRARFIGTNVKQQGSFFCSNKLYNDLYHMYVNSQRANLHGSVVTDTPHRDRTGLTSIGQLASEPLLLTFSSYSLVRKWIDDILDSQDLVTGYVPNSAPYMGALGGISWGGSIVILPFKYYQETGDIAILQKTYKAMQLYMDYLKTAANDEFVIDGTDNELFQGEINTPDRVELPKEFINTCMYAYLARLMVYVSEELDEDSSEYVIACKNIVKTITKKWYDPARKSFFHNVQGANAYALWVNAVPKADIKAVAKNMAEHIENTCEGHLDTGVFGTPILLDMLTKYSYARVAYNAMNKMTYPSFGYMRKMGSSTLWEKFNGKGSHNCTLFGSYITWFIRSIVGINLDYISPGYDNVNINPSLVAYFEYASGKLVTVNNELVSVSWNKQGDEIIFDIILPETSNYKFFCPKGYDVVSTKKISATNLCIIIKISDTL
ncbi:MAG: family 78 glycoside hydrolase catalytic domain [Clostridia bacterium]|nr:family 78 glycoside hydrolase catalytic domain [Clostridia bacterium]